MVDKPGGKKNYVTNANPASLRGDSFPCGTGAVVIHGRAGDLEGVVSCPADPTPVPVVAVICHPHSLHGGSMQNKVVHTLARGFEQLGLRTVRFNFRGVGRSDGRYDAGIGETDDLLTVADWVLDRCPDAAMWFAGFSFGAYVAVRAVARRPVSQMVLVAPPVNLYDFTTLASPGGACLVLQGDQDEVVPALDVQDWVTRLDPPPQLTMVPGAGHFFHRRLNDLRTILVETLAPRLSRSPATIR